MIKEAAEKRAAKKAKLNQEKNAWSANQNVEVDIGRAFAPPP